MAILFVLVKAASAWALVACSPASCTPACGSTCTYQTCETPASQSYSISNLPYTFSVPGDACAWGAPNSINTIPVSFSSGGVGTSINRIPGSYGVGYTKCKDTVLTGPACATPPATP